MTSKEQMEQLNKAIAEHLKQYPQSVNHPLIETKKVESLPKEEVIEVYTELYVEEEDEINE